MTEVSGEVEDELIDLNKEPIERKRKRVENVSTDGVNEGTNDLPKAGRVLRSRTLAMSDGEKQVINMEIVQMEDRDKNEMSASEENDDSEASVLHDKKRAKRRPGRPPGTEGSCEVSSLGDGKKSRRGRPPQTESKLGASFPSKRKKGRRGRPPKMERKLEVYTKEDDKVMVKKKVGGLSNEVKRKPGRPPKIYNENGELLLDKKDAKRTEDRKVSENGVSGKKSKVGRTDLGNGVVKQSKGTIESAQGADMGLREQKQLLRDQIVAMLMKAGWTVEYRRRLSKDYQDAVYVDRNGKTHWSVTLAYKKFKEKIDSGNADGKDVAAFNPIPEETLSKLFRNTEKGKKAGRNKKSCEKTIQRKAKDRVIKIKSFDGYIQAKLNQGKQRTLLARRCKEGSDSGEHELYEGSRTLLSWLIGLGTVPVGEKVKYRKGKGKKVLLEGRVLKEGICCDCCNITHTVRDFELHAKSPLGRPYQNIYLDSGNSLFQCLSDSWKKHVETDKIGFVSVDLEGEDPNDDTCNVCGDGGDLICCDSCPSTFHNGCLRIKVSSGDWFCVFCSCKFCGMPCNSSSPVDDNDDDDDDCDLFPDSLTCCLCEEKFHVNCIKGTIAEGLNEEKPAFCGKECLKISEDLQALLGVRHELEEGYSYTILQHRALSDEACLDDSTTVECNSKLAVAFAVMDECFEPIIDERSETNMIHNVVYSCGSNIRRLNFVRFFTIILEKGDELAAVASLRIHGSQLAEMPFIGTRFLYRRQRMCTRLLTAIETVLRSLGVEKLVIPAISELNETWTKVFGFVPLKDSERLEMKHMSMIVFPGVAMLKKPIPEQIESADTKCNEVNSKHQNTQENPASDSNTSHVAEDCNGSAVPDFTETQTNHKNTQEEQSDNDNDAVAGTGK